MPTSKMEHGAMEAAGRSSLGPRRSDLQVSAKGICMKRELSQNLIGDEIHHTACSLLVILTNLCRKLHRQKDSSVFAFSYKIGRWRAGLRQSPRATLPTGWGGDEGEGGERERERGRGRETRGSTRALADTLCRTNSVLRRGM